MVQSDTLSKCTQGYLICLALFTLIIGPGTVSGQQIRLDQMQIYVQSDTLKLDAQIDTLFSRRTLNAIETGMTASILIQFRLATGPQTILRPHPILSRLEHDIWEGEYRVVRFSNQPDTLETTSFDTVRTYCAQLQGIPLGPLPGSDRELTLQYHIEVNPISPEQQRRTRRWLNLLERWSLLEFFIQLNRSSEGTGWIDLLRFIPSSLPHILPTPLESPSEPEQIP